MLINRILIIEIGYLPSNAVMPIVLDAEIVHTTIAFIGVSCIRCRDISQSA